MTTYKPGYEPFRQPTPKMQAVSLVQSIEGWLSNLEDGETTVERYIDRMKLCLTRLKRLYDLALEDGRAPTTALELWLTALMLGMSTKLYAEKMRNCLSLLKELHDASLAEEWTEKVKTAYIIE